MCGTMITLSVRPPLDALQFEIVTHQIAIEIIIFLFVNTENKEKTTFVHCWEICFITYISPNFESSKRTNELKSKFRQNLERVFNFITSTDLFETFKPSLPIFRFFFIEDFLKYRNFNRKLSYYVLINYFKVKNFEHLESKSLKVKE